MCRCQDREQDTGGREEGPASLLPGPWDRRAEGQRESQEELAVCKQINQQINFSDAQLVVLSNPAVLPVCRFHFTAGLGKQGSASVPGPAKEQSLGAGERRAEARAGGQAGRGRIYGRGVEEGKSPPRVCVGPLVCASVPVLCVCASVSVCLCRCNCVSVYMCVHGWVGEMGRE